MNTATLTQLREARALLAKGWTQDAYARDINGECIYSGAEENIVSYCIVGALQHIEAKNLAYGTLRKCLPFGSRGLLWWNDTIGRTQDEVLELFDKAIAKLEV